MDRQPLSKQTHIVNSSHNNAHIANPSNTTLTHNTETFQLSYIEGMKCRNDTKTYKNELDK